MSPNAESPGVLQQFVDRARQLYSLPVVVMRALELTDRPEIDVQALKECIENDPALTAKILRVVNSSLFRLARPVTDLNQALALLGVKPLKLLVLGFSLPKDLFAGVEARVLERYWRHTLIKAVACREFSKCFGGSSGDEAFIVGLLQDIGVLALVQNLGEPYVRFLDRVYAEREDLARLEVASLGFDHGVLSARLLQHWGLPETIVRAVGWPHDIEQTLSLAPGEQPLARALHLAELAARLLTRGDPGVLSEIQEAGARFAGPTAEQISAVIDTLEAKVQQLADVFSVRLPDRDHCLEVLVEAHAQLRETAEEAAVDLSQGGLGGALAEQARALRGVIERGAVCNRPPAAIAAAPRRGEVEGKARGAATSPHHGQTAVADDPGLLGRLAAAVAGCRQARCAVSLALMELDDLESLLLDPGPGPAASLIGQMKLVIDSRLEPPDCCYQIDDARFALIFRDCDRHQGVESVKRIVRNVQRWSERQPETAGRAVTFSVGLAALSLPPKNFPCCELIEAAERCLYGSRAAGGDGVKSILIY